MTKNILTVDLEDWYQSSTELFCKEGKAIEVIYPSERVITNTEKLLLLFEKYNTKATFFVLGTVAERYPELIGKIEHQGHEIATHGYAHKLVYKQTKEEFRQDLRKSMDIIAHITGKKVLGYRAPYFSIREDSLWAFGVLKEEGLKYDASIFPLKRKLYGVNDMNKINTNGMIEFSASKTSLFGYEFPFGGGGYLRLFPYSVTRWAIRRLNQQGCPAMVYIHPYELDTEDFQSCGLASNARTNFTRFTQKFNRGKTENKLKMLLRDFEFANIKDYLRYNCPTWTSQNQKDSWLAQLAN